MKTVKELQGMLDLKRAELAKIFEDAKTIVDGEDRYDLTPEQVLDVKARNDELNDLQAQLEEAQEVDETFKANQKAIADGRKAAGDLPLNRGNGSEPGEPKAKQVKSLGEQFVESRGYKERQNGKDILADLDFEIKTLMERTAGFEPESTRTGRVVFYAHRRPVVADVIPQVPTDQSSIKYMEETTFTNNSDTVAEGGSFPEAALAYTERSTPIEKVATFLPVTDEQMEDEDGMMGLIDNRLMTMILLTEEIQLLTGSGVAPDLTGFLVKSGVQSQAKGTDPVPDAVYKGMTLVRHTGFAEPSAIIMHPNDWQDVRLLRTTDGIYIWGHPSEPGPERMWGLPIVPTTAETENTALLGDFQLYSEIRRKRGVTLKASDSHSDYFVKGKQAIRADERLALLIYRAAAFCKVTGI